jgi:hypothetical protein
MNLRFLLGCAAGLALSGTALAADETAGSKPTPEHEKLGYFVGKWTMEGELKETPMGPGGKLTAKDNCEWFEGKFAVVCHTTGTSPMGSTKGIGILGYSPEEKAYSYYGLDNSGQVQMTVPRGSRDGEVWTFTDESKMGGKMIKSRYIIKEVSASEYTFKWEIQTDDGKWAEVLSGKETKVASSKKKKSSTKPADKPAEKPKVEEKA